MARGTALHTIRYDRMPKGDIDSLCDALAGDVVTLLGKRRDLDVVLLTDGAPELRDRLAQHLSHERIGVEARQLVDFWHVRREARPSGAGDPRADCQSADRAAMEAAPVQQHAGRAADFA